MTNDEYFHGQLEKEFQTSHELNENGTYYTESEYEELNRNLILYKEGNREAGNYIIKVFHPFITKYTRFIVNGDLPYFTVKNSKTNYEYRRVSPTISSFVSLFCEKEEGVDKKKQFSNTCLKIKTLFSKYEYFDIYNELVLALLNMANKYKVITDVNDPHYKKNGTFHMYVSKCFHWEAHRFLKKMVADPLAHFEVYRLQDQFDDMEIESEDSHDIVVKDEQAERNYENMIETISRQNDIEYSNKLTLREDKDLTVYDIETLNFNWTSGVTCSKLFKGLSAYERELIVLSFVENKSSQEISEIYGCHRATINLHKNRAIEKIKIKAQELGITL